VECRNWRAPTVIKSQVAAKQSGERSKQTKHSQHQPETTGRYTGDNEVQEMTGD
jgi:hypothetical protein